MSISSTRSSADSRPSAIGLEQLSDEELAAGLSVAIERERPPAA